MKELKNIKEIGNHPNIINTRDTFYWLDLEKNEINTYIIMDLCDKDLEKEIKDRS